MGWVMPSKYGKKLGCPHNLQRRIEYRFSGKDTHSLRYLIDQPHQRIAQPGDEMVLLCPFGCEEISILITKRHDDDGMYNV